MNRIGRIALVMIGLVAVAAGAYAIGKVTVDPNLPGNRVESLAVMDEARLKQEITYEARRKSVLAILDDLGELSGITLRAGHNDLDWQVRDRRMTIAASGIPLADLMRSIARVMRFQWSRTGQGDTLSYRLYMDRKATLDGELRREREVQKRTEKRGQFVQDCLGSDRLTDEESAGLKEDHPARYILNQTGIASALGAFFGEAPAAGEALSAGTELEMPFSQLTPKARQALTRFAEGVRKLDSSDSSAPNLDGTTVRINRADIATRPAFVLGVIVVNGGEPGSSFGFPILDPDSRTEAAAARATIKCMEEGRPMSQAETQEIEALAATETGELQTSEPQWKHGDDPALGRLVKVDALDALLDEAQVALAKGASVSVVSDSSASNDLTVTLPSEETALRVLLSALGTTYWYNWAKRGSIIEFQDRDWIRKRAAQVPDAWLDAWRSAFETQGVMRVGALAQIAVLAPEQLSESIATDDVLRAVMPTISAYGDVLRLYTSLTAAQRKLLLGKSGLEPIELSAEQREKARALIPSAEVTFSATNSTEAGTPIFTIKATPAANSAPKVWRIGLPTCSKKSE